MRSLFLGLAMPAMLLIQTAGDSVGHGLHFIVDVAVERPVDGQLPAVERVMTRMLPDGTAELEFWTDGRSVRRAQRGRLASEPDGTITLVQEGLTRYVLDPVARTYYVMAPETTEVGHDLDAELTMNGPVDRILGYSTQQVTITYREPAARPSSQADIGTQVELWCTTDLPVPASISDLMSPIAGLRVSSAVSREYLEVCPFPLRMLRRNSLMPGYTIVTTVTSILRTSPPTDMFILPRDYREIPMPIRR